MFNWSKKKLPPEQPQIRDVLFGDLPFTKWPSDEFQTAEPWATFIRARQSLSQGNQAEAVQALREIVAQPGLESRHYLQAWHFLREQGVQPTEGAKQVFGVIVEVALPKGLEIVAAYVDHSARYFNFSGAAVIWERPDDSLDLSIDAFLKSGEKVVSQIGVWEGPRPPAPPKGQARINMLTPSGLHFGQADMDILSEDAMGGPVIALAITLMQQLIAKTSTN